MELDGTISMTNGGGRPADDAHPAVILVLRGDSPLGPTLRFSLDDVDRVELGRGDELCGQTICDADRVLSITLPDRHVSSEHARLVRSPQGDWLVEDAGSKNGTAVNGTRCQRAALSDGDLIDVGCACFLFRLVVPGRGGDADPPPLPALATFSPSLAASFAAIERIARSRLSILLMGQTGVGKEVVARAAHDLSGRSGAFVAVNCAAIPSNLVESTLFGHRRGAFSGASESRAGTVRSAAGGTLFLDEIGELSPAAQASLLRVVQEREVVPVGESDPVPVDVRFVAATNRDLWAEVEAGGFREDLLARLTGLTVRLPPLCERREDLGLLVSRLLPRLTPDPHRVRLTPRATRALVHYSWPRNIRELESCLSAAILLAGGDDIDLVHLPGEIQCGTGPSPLASTRIAPAHPRPSLATLMELHRGNITAVARALATSRSQVRRLLRRQADVSPRVEPDPAD